LKGKQEGRRKIERTMRIGGISPQAAETETSNAMTTSMAEETGNTTSANDNRAYSMEEVERMNAVMLYS